MILRVICGTRVIFLANLWENSKMLTNSILFDRFLLVLLLHLTSVELALAQLPQLDSQQKQWLGERVFENECLAVESCLTSWNPGEEFPSLGVGHFIWFQANQTTQFVESFPQLLNFYEAQGYAMPDWIAVLTERDSPWRNRTHFYQEINSAQMNDLRQFLANSKPVQIEFIIQRLYDSLPKLIAATAPSQRQQIESSFYQLAYTSPPYGIYALMDYVHFKGEGTTEKERYQGQGWGLLQVLEKMQAGAEDPIVEFVTAAERVLRRRVNNAPSDRAEQRWLAGWNNRLQTYLPD